MIILNNTKAFHRILSVLSIVFALLMIFSIYSSERYVVAVKSYGLILGGILVGVLLFSANQKKGMICIGLLSIVWLILQRVIQGELYIENTLHFVAGSILCWGVAFWIPFEDNHQNTFLLLIMTVYAITLGILCAIGIYSALSQRSIVLPFLNSVIQMEDKRLTICGIHTNVTATLFLMGSFCSVGLAIHYHRLPVTIVAVLFCICFYFGISLTVSRTIMLIYSFAGAVSMFFLLISNQFFKRWKKMLALILALFCAFIFYKGLENAPEIAFRIQQNYLVRNVAISETTMEYDKLNEKQELELEVIQSSSKADESYAVSRPILNDITTLTFRTEIYRAALQYLAENPKAIFFGANMDVTDRFMSEYCGRTIYHSHNAFLQVLLTFGLPALLISLFTVWQVIHSVCLFLFRKMILSSEKKFILLLCVCLLINCITEPILFTLLHPAIDFIFLLCIGYISREKHRFLLNPEKCQ